MIITDKEKKSLQDAIIYTSCGKLPPINDTNKLWVKAIIRVQKITGRYSYIYAKHCYVGGDDSFSTLKDFGEPARISKVDSIYPLEYADVPKFKDKNEIIAYLSKGYHQDVKSFKDFKKEQLEIALNQLLINQYINKHGK